jgi:hypothetical protein
MTEQGGPFVEHRFAIGSRSYDDLFSTTSLKFIDDSARECHEGVVIDTLTSRFAQHASGDDSSLDHGHGNLSDDDDDDDMARSGNDYDEAPPFSEGYDSDSYSPTSQEDSQDKGLGREWFDDDDSASGVKRRKHFANKRNVNRKTKSGSKRQKTSSYAPRHEQAPGNHHQSLHGRRLSPLSQNITGGSFLTPSNGQAPGNLCQSLQG